jgi:hypothetical protein
LQVSTGEQDLGHELIFIYLSMKAATLDLKFLSKESGAIFNYFFLFGYSSFSECAVVLEQCFIESIA